jgi:hypothetical protein
MGAALTATKKPMTSMECNMLLCQQHICANNTEETLQITNHQRAALPSDDNALQPFAGTAKLLGDDNEINRQTAQGIINDLALECVTAENASDARSKLESYAKGDNFNDFGPLLMD